MRIKGHMSGRQVDLDITLTGREKIELKRFLIILNRGYDANMREEVANEIAEIMGKKK